MKLAYRLSMCALLVAAACAAQARDTTLRLPFDPVVAKGTADGKLDGSVKFYLAGKAPAGGTVVKSNVVTNRKTNGVGKPDEEACEWALLAALIVLQDAAKTAGADTVRNITSYYKKVEFKDGSQYECHAGGVMVGVALKADLAKH